MNATRSVDSHVGNSIGDFVLKVEIVPELDRTHAVDVTWWILFSFGLVANKSLIVLMTCPECQLFIAIVDQVLFVMIGFLSHYS